MKKIIWLGIGVVLIVVGKFAFKKYQEERRFNEWEETTVKHVEYYDNGQPSLVIVNDTTAHEKFYRFFYEDGKVEKEYLEVKGKIDGTVNFYYPTGEVEQKHQYVNGLQNGMCELFYKDGSLKDKTPYVNGKREGTGTFFNRQGIIKAQNAFIDDKLYWKQINTLDSIGNIVSTYETYLPIAELNKDTLLVGDTVLAKFTIPFGKTKFDQSSILEVKYDTCLETDSLPEPGYRITLENGKGELELPAGAPGNYYLFGYLTSDHDGIGEAHEYFLEEYLVLSIDSI